MNELAEELVKNPRLFAYRIAELIADVRDMRQQIRKGSWLAVSVLIAVVLDLAMRLMPGNSPTTVTHAVVSLFT
ncbi:MAG: hypothetical protein ACXVHX_22730 [Solirubrobacteraceae bacterium]